MHRPFLRRIRSTGAAAALIAAAVHFQAPAAAACDGAGCASEAATCEASEAASSNHLPGMRVSIDPKTGSFVDAPAPPPSVAARATVAAAPPAMRSIPGGGSLLDTRNFRHEITATAVPGALPRTSCEHTEKPAAPVE